MKTIIYRNEITLLDFIFIYRRSHGVIRYTIDSEEAEEVNDLMDITEKPEDFIIKSFYIDLDLTDHKEEVLPITIPKILNLKLIRRTKGGTQCDT